jgi:hypothetical protein
MNKKTYFFISGLVFAIVAAVHLLRIINQFQIVIGTWSAPMSVSWIGIIIPGLLSYCGFVLMSKEKGV